MNRLTSELYRLYSATPPEAALADEAGPRLIDAQGRVRALVLELGRPADWAALLVLWQGVQADLGLPAPAIVVQGVDAYQLWFSLAQPLPAAQAQAFLQALVARYLGHIPAHRLRLLPAADTHLPGPDRHAASVPQPLADAQWSAFVSADLAPLFNETPWLDMAPNPDGQASLLATLKCIQPDPWQQALRVLMPGPAAAADAALVPRGVDGSAAGNGAQRVAPARLPQEPRQFLLDVMNDQGVSLALRIEAAKALLT